MPFARHFPKVKVEYGDLQCLVCLPEQERYWHVIAHKGRLEESASLLVANPSQQSFARVFNSSTSGSVPASDWAALHEAGTGENVFRRRWRQFHGRLKDFWKTRLRVVGLLAHIATHVDKGRYHRESHLILPAQFLFGTSDHESSNFIEDRHADGAQRRQPTFRLMPQRCGGCWR